MEHWKDGSGCWGRENWGSILVFLYSQISIPSFQSSIEASMRHRVKNDVDAKGVGIFFRVGLEVARISPLFLPAVAEVGVVADAHHHAAFVVIHAVVVRT